MRISVFHDVQILIRVLTCLNKSYMLTHTCRCYGRKQLVRVSLSVEGPYGPGDRYCEAGPGCLAGCLGGWGVCPGNLSGHVQIMAIVSTYL